MSMNAHDQTIRVKDLILMDMEIVHEKMREKESVAALAEAQAKLADIALGAIRLESQLIGQWPIGHDCTAPLSSCPGEMHQQQEVSNAKKE